MPYGAESMLMMVDRWQKLERALYKSLEHPDKGGVFDCSQIPDVYDSVKFDLIHNSHLNCDYSRVRCLIALLAKQPWDTSKCTSMALLVRLFLCAGTNPI